MELLQIIRIFLMSKIGFFHFSIDQILYST